jgi:hypothetical protein
VPEYVISTVAEVPFAIAEGKLIINSLVSLSENAVTPFSY